MRTAARALALGALLLLAPCGRGSDGPAIEDATDDYQVTPWLTDVAVPVSMAFLPSGDALVLEKGGFAGEGTGAVKVVGPDGTVKADALSLPVCTDAERGLLGVAIDPAFAENGFVYLYYTAVSEDCAVAGPRGSVVNRLSRFTMAGDTIDPASEVVMVDGIDGAQSAHNGGDLVFGPDGTLYVGVGNASKDDAADTPSQDVSKPNGKVLRLDPRNPDDVVPADNPFVDDATADPLVWAYGLRNPFRLAVRPEDGAVLIGDVGSGGDTAVEELNLGASGANYGWPDAEGPSDGDTVDPIWSYDHEDGCASIIVGDFLPDDRLGAATAGQLAVADFVCGAVWLVAFEGDEVAQVRQVARIDGQMSDVVVGPDGFLYVIDIRDNEILRVEPT